MQKTRDGQWPGARRSDGLEDFRCAFDCILPAMVRETRGRTEREARSAFARIPCAREVSGRCSGTGASQEWKIENWRQITERGRGDGFGGTCLPKRAWRMNQAGNSEFNNFEIFRYKAKVGRLVASSTSPSSSLLSLSHLRPPQPLPIPTIPQS